MNQPSKQTVGQLSFVLGILFTLIVLLVFGTKCSAQSGETGPLPIAPPTYDTIPVSLLVRIQGRPWAFFHDGWEVRKVASVRQQKTMTANEHGFVPGIYLLETVPIYSHLLYLDTRKRPIRKEWVVYQKFNR